MLSSIPESISVIKHPKNWKNTRLTFFKFMTRETGRIVLQNRTLRWSRPAFLNDPHDNQFHLLPQLEHGEAKRRALEKLWETHYSLVPVDQNNELGRLIAANRHAFPQMPKDQFVAEFSEAFDEIFDAMPRTIAKFNDELKEQMATNKLLCLTERVDDTLMWAHYAEAHQGIALRLRSIPELDSQWGAAEPVVYRDQLPPLLDVEHFSDVVSGRASLEIESVLHAMIFTKGVAWSHEKEWRIYGGEGWEPHLDFEDISFRPFEVDAIVLGCRMPSDEARDFVEIAARDFPHASVFRSVPARDSFDLKFEQLL